MIRHVALFNLKPEIGEEERDWLFNQIRNLDKVPSVNRLSLGKLLDPREAWYKPRLTTDFEWSLSMDFDDESALYAYQTDSYHVIVAQEIRKRVTAIRVMDFVDDSK